MTLDRYFLISERGSTVAREIRGGITTFVTMAYIVVLNPLILGGGVDSTGAKLPQTQVAAATALVAGLMTIFMGAYARFPLALAAGLGVNALVAYTIAPEMTWADAMGLVVIEGVVILIVVLTGARQMIFNAVPTQLKTAIGVGIGLFLALIGFVDAGFVRGGTASPPLNLGVGGILRGWPSLVFAIGLLGMIVLMMLRVRGAILIGIIGATVLAIIIESIGHLGGQSASNPDGWSLNVPKVPRKIVDVPDLHLVGHFNVLGSWREVGVLVTVLFIFTLVLSDFFDTMGTMVAVGQEAGLIDERGNPPNTREILVVDSIAAAAGGVASVSSNTSYVESAAGVGEGARTGLASLATGVLLVAAMFFAPLVQIVPFEAATPALVVVGFLMMTTVVTIDWADYEIAIPAFLTIVLMPFTYSISNGIGAGVVTYTLLKVVRGKARVIHPLLWVVAGLFLIYFFRGPIEDAVR